MALIKCPECNHEVSEFAATCPNCGYGIAKQSETKSQPPLQTKSNSIPSFLLIVFLLLAIFSVFPLYKSISEIPSVESMIGIESALVDAGELSFSTMTYDKTEKHKEKLNENEKKLSSLKNKRNLSIVSIIVSSISMCVCFLVIRNNNKNNEIIEKSQKSDDLT